jgi:tetratricopeptide (TPR) repeat protein
MPHGPTLNRTPRARADLSGHRENEDRRAARGEDDACSAAAVLAGARLARSDPATAERAVMRALDLAPDDVEVRLAAYRFYFYNHRLAEALRQAASIVVQMARRLNVATDWRLVRPGDAAFSGLDEAPSLYLQALLAWGYGSVRLGGVEEGCRALEKAVELDPRDRFGAHRLLRVIAAGGNAEDD